ncbi:MAG: glycosyltransferase, partial [Desulfuromonadaceae bacterium]
MKKNLLVITTVFPNPNNMMLGAYNREIISELSEYYNIDVIVPIPWTKCFMSGKPKNWMLNKAKIHHPIFYYPSGILHRVHDDFYYLSISRLIKKLTSHITYTAVFGMWLYPDCRVVKKIAHNFSIPYFVKVLGTDVNRLDVRHPLFSQSMSVLKDAARIICVSEGLKNRLESLGVSSEKLIVLRNGINKSIFFPCSPEAARQKLALPIKQEIILFVGNLKREKGLHELICAFDKIRNNQKHSEAILCLVGEGPFEKELLQYITLNGMYDSVRFVGRQSSSEVALCATTSNVLTRFSEFRFTH